MRQRVFCWLPTRVHLVPWWRTGFKWLDFAYLDADGKYYVTKEPMEVDIDRLMHGRKAT